VTNPIPHPSAVVPGGQARGDASRGRLLAAALDSFADRGFHGTGSRDIAQRAGMSPSALYVHYRTKEELLYTLSSAGHRHILEVVEAATGLHTCPADQLREVIEQYAAWHARFHTNARVVQYEMAALSPGHKLEIADLRRAVEVRVRSIVGAGVANGEFTVRTPNTAALALLSLGIDVARWYREDGTWTPEQIGQEYGELALGMVGWTGTSCQDNSSRPRRPDTQTS
jgi:AcrR family transcriptional regulator